MSHPRKTVVVTGASAGVGRAVAVRFGREGWQVGLIARGPEGLDSARREIEAVGGTALALPADVSDAAALDAAAERFERELGPIDVWINNAMVTVYATAVDVTPDEFLQVTRVTYLGQVHGTQSALKRMRLRDRGVVVCIGSALAYRSIPFQAPYCAAKAATRAFIDSLRSELLWEGSQVRLTMVHLPAVNTPQFDWARSKFDRRLGPVPPIYQPETVADAVFRAANETPREYWLGFSTVEAIVAQMLVPAWVDRYLAKGGKANETTDRPAIEGRPDNLFEAGHGDPGAHGRFDNRSRDEATPVDPAWLRAGLAVAGIAAVTTVASLTARLATRSRNAALPSPSRSNGLDDVPLGSDVEARVPFR